LYLLRQQFQQIKRAKLLLIFRQEFLVFLHGEPLVLTVILIGTLDQEMPLRLLP